MTSLGALLVIVSWKIFLVQGCDTNQDSCRDQVLNEPVPDKVLVGHVIGNKTVSSPELCRVECYLEPKCVSSNFYHNAPNSPNCQLSSSEAESHPRDLVPKPGALYQGTKNNCRNVTCPSSLMECHSGYNPQGYRCRFPDHCCKVSNQRVLYFPRKSKEDYLKVVTSFPSHLTAFTLSLMVKIEVRLSGKQAVTPFSMATKKKSNNLLIYITHDRMRLDVTAKTKGIDVSLHDGEWHHICATWESTSGKWQLYVDGKDLGEGTGLATGQKLNNGIVILGQEQDSFGGHFDENQSFMGFITGVSLWDRVLLPHGESFLYLNNFECHPQPGNILKWEDLLKGEFHGNMKLLNTELP